METKREVASDLGNCGCPLGDCTESVVYLSEGDDDRDTGCESRYYRLGDEVHEFTDLEESKHDKQQS